jgi:heat shock protein HslJ
MTVRIATALHVLLLIASSGCDAMEEPSEVIFHVNSFRAPCVGVGPMNCLQIKRGDPAKGEWQHFYSSIDGFSFEPGYRYRLRVRETRLPPDRVPADASSIRYELIEILDKFPDPRTAIHDIWMLESIDGIAIDAFDPGSRDEPPFLEFNVTRGRFLGNDGCNPIDGTLDITEAPQLRLVRDIGTESVPTCGDGLLQARLGAALDRVTSWQRNGLSLSLLDGNGGEILLLRKTD